MLSALELPFFFGVVFLAPGCGPMSNIDGEKCVPGSCQMEYDCIKVKDREIKTFIVVLHSVMIQKLN